MATMSKAFIVPLNAPVAFVGTKPEEILPHIPTYVWFRDVDDNVSYAEKWIEERKEIGTFGLAQNLYTPVMQKGGRSRTMDSVVHSVIVDLHRSPKVTPLHESVWDALHSHMTGTHNSNTENLYPSRLITPPPGIYVTHRQSAYDSLGLYKPRFIAVGPGGFIIGRGYWENDNQNMSFCIALTDKALEQNGPPMIVVEAIENETLLHNGPRFIALLKMIGVVADIQIVGA